MKRFAIVGLALCTIAAAAFAEEEVSPSINVGGELTYGFVVNPDTAPTFTDLLDTADINLSGNMDAYNSYRIRLDFNGGTDELQEADDLAVDEAFIRTDLARYFGLDAMGVVIEWRNGFDDTNASVYSAGTRYAFDEDTIDNDDLSTDDTWISEMTLGFTDLVRLKSAWAWDTAQGADDIPEMLFEVSSAPVPGVNAAVMYSTNRTAGGTIGVSSSFALAEFVPTFVSSGIGLDLGASVAYNLSESDDFADSGVEADFIAPEQAVWGASAKVTYLGADLGVSYLGGAEDDENAAAGFAVIGVDAGYQLIEDLGVYGGVALDFTDYEAIGGGENIDGVAGGEFGVSWDIGGLNVKTGYWFSDGYAAGSIDALGEDGDGDMNPDGGMFFRFSYEWGI